MSESWGSKENTGRLATSLRRVCEGAQPRFAGKLRLRHIGPVFDSDPYFDLKESRRLLGVLPYGRSLLTVWHNTHGEPRDVHLYDERLLDVVRREMAGVHIVKEFAA